MKFTLRQLTAFAAVARTGHFGKAADALQLSQPTVSADVKALERGLRVTLFHRSRAGTTLTTAGSNLLPYAHELLERADQLHQAALAAAVEETRQIRLAVTPSLVNRLVPQVLHELSSSTEKLEVQIVEVPTGGVGQAIVAREADLGIGHFVDIPPGCSRATIGFNQLWLLADSGTLSPVHSADLSRLKARKVLIWPRDQNPEYYDFIIDVCRERGLTPNTQESPMRISGAYSYLLTTGEAFALVPEDFARDAPTSLSCAPLMPAALLPLHAVWRSPAVPGVGQLVTTLRGVQRRLTSA